MVKCGFICGGHIKCNDDLCIGINFVHSDGLFYFITHCWFLNNNQIVMMDRSTESWYYVQPKGLCIVCWFMIYVEFYILDITHLIYATLGKPLSSPPTVVLRCFYFYFALTPRLGTCKEGKMVVIRYTLSAVQLWCISIK